MGHQGPCHQVYVAIRASDYLAEPVLVGLSLPCHPESICLCIVAPKHVAWLASHANHVEHIGVEAHVFKQLCQGVKFLLKASCPHQREKTIPRKKILCQPLHVLPKTLSASRARVHRLLRRCYHSEPVGGTNL